MTLSFWQQSTRAAEVPCDVAVVGGGIIGCSAAYWLRQLRPGLRVAIVEAGRLAQGASGRNAGFLLQGTAHDYLADRKTYGAEVTRQLWHFTKENRDLIASELRPNAFDLEASGSLSVAGTQEENERMQAAVPYMRADGAPVAYIPPQETNKRLTAQHFLGALYVPSGAMLHPAKLVQHIAEASEARVLPQHRVAEIVAQGDGAVLETPVRRIRAGQVVLALNAYLPLLYPSLSRYVRPIRAQMFATRPIQPRWLQVPIYSHEGYYYLRQLRDGTVLLGGARHLHRAKEVGYQDAITLALQRDLLTFLHHHFPQTDGAQVVQRWSGTMGFSPDGLPNIGEVPEIPGSIWAAGFTGHGMGYGFRFGKLLAEVALGEPRPAGLDLFTVDRFKKPAATVVE